MNCPICAKEVLPEWNVCPFCGYKPKKCSNPACNSGWLPKDANFCPICGKPICESASEGPAHKPANNPSSNPGNSFAGNAAQGFVGNTASDYTGNTASRMPLLEETFLVNYFFDNNIVSGRLRIEEERAVFTAKFMLIGNGSETVIPIADITGYKRGMLTFLYIYMRNGVQHKLTTYDKNGIINALELRRERYYQKKGMAVPQLTQL